jgi:hypothetical protein
MLRWPPPFWARLLPYGFPQGEQLKVFTSDDRSIVPPGASPGFLPQCRRHLHFHCASGFTTQILAPLNARSNRSEPNFFCNSVSEISSKVLVFQDRVAPPSYATPLGWSKALTRRPRATYVPADLAGAFRLRRCRQRRGRLILRWVDENHFVRIVITHSTFQPSTQTLKSYNIVILT